MPTENTSLINSPVPGVIIAPMPAGQSGDLYPQDAYGASVLLQSDGKLLLGGQVVYRRLVDVEYDFYLEEYVNVYEEDYNLAVARFNPDGSLDTSFDDDGWAIVSFDSPHNDGGQLALQPDGKILVAGFGGGGEEDDFTVARLNADGSLDTSFDGDGRVSVNIFDHADQAHGITLDADGKIVLAGTSDWRDAYGNDHSFFTLARLNADGSLDPSFNRVGAQFTNLSSSTDIAWDVAVQADGKIVAAGQADQGEDMFALVRYQADGSLDDHFGDPYDYVAANVGDWWSDYARAVAVQADGKLLVAGWSENETDDFALARFNADGSLDTGFGTGGSVVTDLRGSSDEAYGLALQADGKILLAGHSGNDARYENEIALVRYHADGSLDTDFGTGGKVITNLRGGGDYARDITLQPDGKIVVAGYSYDGERADDDFALVRYNADGSLDTSFNGQGIPVDDTPVDDTPVDDTVAGGQQDGGATGDGGTQGDGGAMDEGGSAETTHAAAPLDRIARVSPTGAAGHAWQPAVSADGRYLVFASGAADLVPGDANGAQDIFWRDLVTGATRRVSVASDGGEADAMSWTPAISGDGRQVAFVSSATNLVAGAGVGQAVYVHDIDTGVTRRVSQAADGAAADGASWGPSLSADGRQLAFGSAATNLVAGDTNGSDDVFVHYLETGDTRLATLSPDGGPANSLSHGASLSPDGGHIAYSSYASNLLAGDTDTGWDLYLRDLVTGVTHRVASVDDTNDPALSDGGRYVAFQSVLADLVPGDANGKEDVFVHDLLTGTTWRVSVAVDGGEADGGSWDPDISADGRFVAFDSWAANLVPDDSNGLPDVFVHDRHTGQTVRVSLPEAGGEADGYSLNARLSADGHYVVFDSWATNLVAGDANGDVDVFRVPNPLHGLVNAAPTVAQPLADQSAALGVAFQYELPAGSFDDAESGSSLTLAATLADGSPLPAWLAFDAAGARFYGTPDDDVYVGDIEIEVSASDPGGATARDVFTLAVEAAPQPTGVIAGGVASWRGQAMAGVELRAEAIGGAGAASARSGADGAFELTGLADGRHAITASFADSAGTAAVDQRDAHAALRLAVALDPDGDPASPVAASQYLAADVNGDGRVTSADALAILKMSLGIGAARPAWSFAEADAIGAASRTQVPHPGTPTAAPGEAEVQLVGILLGDVDGSWGSEG